MGGLGGQAVRQIPQDADAVLNRLQATKQTKKKEMKEESLLKEALRIARGCLCWMAFTAKQAS